VENGGTSPFLVLFYPVRKIHLYNTKTSLAKKKGGRCAKIKVTSAVSIKM
jgi:hypothetical protein